VLSACAVYAGRRFGQLLGQKLDIAGGAVLVALAGKIALEALTGR
jgi:putative Mn2+ efflux pump MntP